MAEEELRKTINEIKETVIRMDTRMSMMASQLDDSVPKPNGLEKDTERQKTSLKQAHHWIDELNTRFQWTLGACITIVGIIVGVCFK